MTHTRNYTPDHDLGVTLDAIIRTHGLARVLLAALGTRLNAPPGRRAVNDARGLSNHLRRDIGLNPVATRAHHWTRVH